MAVVVGPLLAQTQKPGIEDLHFPDLKTNAGTDPLFALGFQALLASLLNQPSQTATGLSSGPALLAGKPASANPLTSGAFNSDELFSELEMLAGPLSKLIRNSIASGQPAGIELRSKSTGKLAVWFDPKSKHLSVLSVDPAGTSTDQVNLFEQTMHEDGLSLGGKKNGSVATRTLLPLNPKSQLRTRPNSAARVRLALHSQKNQVLVGQSGKTAPGGKVRFVGEVENTNTVAVTTKYEQGLSHKKAELAPGDAKQWLRNALARKGIHVEEIELHIKDAMQDSSGTRQAGRRRRAAATPPTAARAQKNLSIKQPNASLAIETSVQKARPASDEQRPRTHGPRVASKEARDEVQQQVQPEPKQRTRQGSTVEQVEAEAKNSSARKPILPELDLLQVDQANRKPGLLVDKMKPTRAPLAYDDARNGANGDQDLPDKPDSQRPTFFLKSVTKDRSNIWSKRQKPLEAKASTRHVVNILAPDGRPTFDVANGRLVASEPIQRSRLAEMIERITEITQNQTHLSNQKLEVQIEVEKIGRVLVDALKQMDKVHLQLHVESNEVRRLLETQLRPLVEQIARDGIDIGKLDVSVRDQRPEQNQQNQPSYRSSDGDEPGSGEGLNHFRRGGQQTPRPKRFDRHRMHQAGSGNRKMEVWA
ncbi:MAG: flagellar hook-length control protein FliK [bacterium]